VALVRRSDVLLGMHGAGLTHALHLAPPPRQQRCSDVNSSDADGDSHGPTGSSPRSLHRQSRHQTAVVELFPYGHSQKGIRNLVHLLGRSSYAAWHNADPARELGPAHTVWPAVEVVRRTEVDVDAVAALVRAAVAGVLEAREGR
jgi:hypothetical protein